MKIPKIEIDGELNYYFGAKPTKQAEILYLALLHMEKNGGTSQQAIVEAVRKITTFI